MLYYYRVLDPAESKEQFPGVHGFLTHKWYFDELYSALIVRPALVVAYWFRWFDLTVIDGIIHFVAFAAVRVSKWDGRFDNGVVDGLVNVVGRTRVRRRQRLAESADRLSAQLRAVSGAGGGRRLSAADVVGDAGVGGMRSRVATCPVNA